MATGRDSNLLVLDADGATGRASLAAGRDLPPCPSVTTGRVDGGTHYYLACPNDFDVRNFAGEIPGLDARANGGYVVAAGSKHASGAEYTWLVPPTDDPLPLPPQWLIDVLKASQRREQPGPIARVIPESRRNVELTRIAGGLRRRGLEPDEIHASLRVVNDNRCKPRLPDDELATIAVSIGNKDAASSLILASCDDVGNADRFACICHGRAVWVEEEELWRVWDGRRWAKSNSGRDLLAKEVAREYQIAAAALPVSALDRDTHLRFSAGLNRNDSLRNMLRWAQSELTVSIRDFDRHPMLLNCLNGTLDLVTGELRQSDPADMLTEATEVEYNPSAECPVWDEFLAYAMESQPAVSGYLQRLVGIFLTGDVSVKMLPIIWGEKDTGKTAFANTIYRLLGPFAQVMSEATLAHQQRKGSGSEATPDIARLRGVRLAVASETASDLKLNEARVKSMTGRTIMTGRPLHGHPFDFEPTHKLLIETNHRPNIPSGDEAVWRRVQLIPFVRPIPEERQDEHFEQKLEAELPGILAWAVGGCLDWQAKGLQVPKEVRAATTEYQAQENPIQQFLDAECVLGADEAIGKTRLWSVYREWCSDRRATPLGKQEFNAVLQKRGIVEFRDSQDNNARKWRGISCDEDGDEANGFSAMIQ